MSLSERIERVQALECGDVSHLFLDGLFSHFSVQASFPRNISVLTNPKSTRIPSICDNDLMRLKNLEIQVHVEGSPLVEHEARYNNDQMVAGCFIASETGKVNDSSSVVIYSHFLLLLGVQIDAPKPWRTGHHVCVRRVHGRHVDRQIPRKAGPGQSSRRNTH